MSNLPVSYPAASLYGLELEHAMPEVMEEYEREEDAQREREEAEAEFTHPCPLRDILE